MIEALARLTVNVQILVLTKILLVTMTRKKQRADSLAWAIASAHMDHENIYNN